jgi:proteasome accessory factor B
VDVSRGKAERLGSLVATLLAAGPPKSLTEILSEMSEYYYDDREVARVDFARDKKDLLEEGIEVETIGAGEDAKYRIDPATYYLPDLGLTDEEAVALNLAASRVRLDGHDPDEALLKLGGFGVEGDATVGLPSDPRLDVLYAAVRAKAPIELSYNGVERTIHGYGLLCRGGFWYLAGDDQTKPGRKNYRVDRIEWPIAAGAPGSYVVPADFVLADALPEEPFELAPDDPIEVDVLLDVLMAPRAVGEIVERRNDGSVVVRLEVRNVDGLRSWLFGLRHHARVLGPPEVVDQITSWLRGMC